MPAMKEASIAFAAIALVTGLVAAWHWYQSSKVEIDPGWNPPGTGGRIEPVMPDLRQLDIEVATNNAFRRSGQLNKVAALWTAASVLASALASIFGAFS